jgi:molybdate transport system ATP-binding protein
MLISRLKQQRLQIDELTINTGEFWCAYGTSRSGINEFLALLEGELSQFEAETLNIPTASTIISFSVQQEIFEDEIRNDDSDFLDRPDAGTLAREFLPEDSLDSSLIDMFKLRNVMETGYRQLSSGQARKLLLLKALLSGVKTLIIDSPYDGLDPLACTELDQAFHQLRGSDLRILVLVRNIEDIPGWCSHLAVFHKGHLAEQGELTTILPELQLRPENGTKIVFGDAFKKKESTDRESLPDELIRMRNGFAGYGEKILFTGLNLVVNKGEHTLITGHNGCGKSTLLHILTGDNPKCYANDLSLFGIQRGSGESIWQLKRHMGIVSPEIHRSYRVPGSALHVVLSGLFDSIGLYQPVTQAQQREARQWLAAIDMAEHAQTPFRKLSYGDQRLILIARALIKQPPLLILDEPTQGLDSGCRRALLDFLESVAMDGTTTFLYVSHRQDEYRSFFKRRLQLDHYSEQ